MDTLSPLFAHTQFQTRFIFNGGLCGPWAMHSEDREALSFHLVTRGQVWLHHENKVSGLHPGDLIVFGKPVRHSFTYSPEDAQGDIRAMRVTPVAQADAGLVCGYFDFADDMAAFILKGLPGLMLISHDSADGIRPLLNLMIDEAMRPAPGQAAILERLADGLLMLILRHHLAGETVLPGILRGLADPALAPALTAVHQNPGNTWTLPLLAAQAHLSRSAFAERFTRSIGCPPGDYLSTFRMHIARQLLKQDTTTLIDVAEHVGYASEAAFAKAFKRHQGVTPGQWRRQHRAQGSDQ